MQEIIKHYTNGEITIVWKPAMCIHSKICWRTATGLPEVFHPATRPWITIGEVPSERVAEQVRKCPSGALSFFMNGAAMPEEAASGITAEVMANGPLLVHGNITVKSINGTATQRSKVTAFCRCGASGNKPYCDGSHAKAGFEG